MNYRRNDLEQNLLQALERPPQAPDTSVSLVGKAAFAVTDPALIVVDFATIEKVSADATKKWIADNPPKFEHQKELDALIQKHFDLKQNARHFEIQVNEAAGQLRLCEERIKQTKQLSDGCESPLGKRNYEVALRRLESIERVDCQNTLRRMRRNNAEAADKLHAFVANELPRLEELRKVVKK